MRLYSELASWWPLVSHPDEYASYASWYAEQLTRFQDARTVLELGSGGGNNAFHMKQRFSMTLLDISGEMLRVSETANPKCEHVRGDMRTVRLGREFDAVFVHDAISLMATVEDLKSTIDTCWSHCVPGGTALLVPDYFRESFAPSTSWGGRDEGSRSLRYLEWTHDDDPTDDQYAVDFAFLLREGRDATRVVHDEHLCGVFSKETWRDVCSSVGFAFRIVERQTTERIGAGAVLCSK